MINVLFGIFDEVFIITMLSFNNLSFNFLNEFWSDSLNEMESHNRKFMYSAQKQSEVLQ